MRSWILYPQIKYSTTMPKLSSVKLAKPTSRKITATARRTTVVKAVRARPAIKVKPKTPRRVTPKNPLQVATLAINAKFNDQGGLKGWLKKATTSVKQCPDKVGYYRHHAGGSIYYSPANGAHAVKGAIRLLWSQQGWERGDLGYPTTDEERGRNAEGEGRFTHFEGGGIFWTPEFGAIQLDGAIWKKYRDIGAEVGPLGFPKQAERGTPDRKGRFVHFEYGSIYSTAKTGACEVHGSIRGYWAQHGWERNADLGYPISDELIPDRAHGWKSPRAFSFSQAVLVSNAVKASSTGSKGVGVKSTATLANRKKLTLNPALGKRKIAASALVAKPMILPLTVLQTLEQEDSENRFSDFENGVLFWNRKTRKVSELNPWTRTSKGKSLRFTGNTIASKVRTELGKSLRLPGCTLGAVTYKSATGYRFDGAGVQNREHQLEVNYRGSMLVGGKKKTCDLQLRVWVSVSWNPLHRTIDATITRFSFAKMQSKMIGMSNTRVEVGKRLDPLLWQRFVIANIPTRDGAKQIAVLSVKTMSNGLVQVYREP